MMVWQSKRQVDRGTKWLFVANKVDFVLFHNTHILEPVSHISKLQELALWQKSHRFIIVICNFGY